MDSVATGAVQFLSGFTDVTSLLGSFSVSDPIVANQGKPWLFSDNNAGVLARVEGTQQSAIVCVDFGGWSTPIPVSTWRFRRLRVDIWTDPLRDTGNNITESSVYTANRCLAVFAAVQYHLQRVDPQVQVWGDMVTTGCSLLTEPQPSPVTDGDFLLRATAYYGVSFSGWTDVTPLP